MTDTLMKLAALAALVLSLGNPAWHVPESNLILMLAIAIGLATCDFFFRKKPAP